MAMVSATDRIILVVDDEARMVRFVRMNLELEGFQVVEANDGVEALEKVRDALPDLVLLDVMMPGMDGFETLARLREISTVPVIMLTVKGEETDRIRGLELGADDYVTKPFSPRELASRIRAVLRRAEMPSPVARTAIRVDDHLEIDFRQREVIVGGERVRLRPTEYRLLYHLVNNAGWIMTHEMLLSKVWGYEYRDETGLLRLYITYLRQKIEPDPAHPRYIFTERGVGYRFVDFKRGAKGDETSSGREAEGQETP
jgi:two-component system KDP operon response regulator KdpE